MAEEKATPDKLLSWITDRIEIYQTKLKDSQKENWDDDEIAFLEGKLEGFIFVQKVLLSSKYDLDDGVVPEAEDGTDEKA